VNQDPAALRLLSWFWTPLVVVTSAADGERSGQAAVSVHGASIVPDRPRLTAGLWKGNYTRDLVEQSRVFAVHLLRDDQDDLVYRFGLQSGRDVNKFAGLDCSTGVTGAPLLTDCLAMFECRVVNHMDAGDHTIFLADVVNSLTGSQGRPLWWRDLRERMPPERRAEWDARSAANAQSAAGLMDILPATQD
jgi:flavin reductase (DIM6/NTAB) family NADH-FMN oxidoreductase RutF